MQSRIPTYVRFSNRPFRVKRFQTIHHSSVDVAHGLLFGIGTKALPSWDSKFPFSRWFWSYLTQGESENRVAIRVGLGHYPRTMRLDYRARF